MSKAKPLSGIVRSYVDSLLKGAGLSERREIGFKEVWQCIEARTYINPHYATVTFTGATRFSSGYAKYEGLYGTWRVELVPTTAYRSQDDLLKKGCTKTWGTPHCLRSSDEWRLLQRDLVLKWEAEGCEIARSAVAQWTRLADIGRKEPTNV